MLQMIMPDNQLLCTATIKNKTSTSILTDPMTCFFRKELKNGVKLLNCVQMMNRITFASLLILTDLIKGNNVTYMYVYTMAARHFYE